MSSSSVNPSATGVIRAVAAADAPKPFDALALFHVILRSSDSVDFFVVRSMLHIVSPVFNDMFSLEAAVTEEDMKNGPPIVTVSEDSETLLRLLSLIYHHDCEPQVAYVPLFLKMCRAARKYSMSVVERKLRPMVNTIELSSSPTTDVARHFLRYTIAVQFGWHAEAAKAARHTFSTPSHEIPYNNELRNISGADFYEYLAFKEGSKTLLVAEQVSFVTKADVEKPLTDAEKPFDSHARADVILRSTDKTDFYVLRDFLRFVTPAFDGVVSTCQKNGLPVLSTEEDGATLRHLLSIIYPCVESQISNVDLFIKVGRAAQRYKMKIVVEKLKQQLDVSRHIINDPMRTLWVAIAFGWGRVAKKAAMNALKQADDAGISRIKELRLVTGADVHQFIKYKFACGDAACEAVLEDRLFASDKTKEKEKIVMRIVDRLKASPRGTCIIDVWASGIQNSSGVSSPYEEKFLHMLWRKRAKLMLAVEVAILKVPLGIDSVKGL